MGLTMIHEDIKLYILVMQDVNSIFFFFFACNTNSCSSEIKGWLTSEKL